MNDSNMVISANPRSKEPNVIIGLPDVGLVGAIATAYMIDQLGMEEIGYIDSDVYHPLVIVKDSKIKRPIRIYEKDDIIALIADMPITPSLAIDFARVFVSWAKDIHATLIINITGIPIPNRVSIDKPRVLALATNYDIASIKDIKPFKDGYIMGTYASIIKECFDNNLASLTLLAETYLNFPDPTAAISVLNVLKSILKVDINLKRLEEEAEMIRLKTRELMKQTENALTRSKVGVPSIYG